MQGVAVAERAYQKAVGYARDRVQSRDVAGSSGPVAIIHHPDVRRMLMTQRALTQGARALAYVAAAASDAGHYAADADTRKANMAVYEYLVPIVKGFSTEMSLEVTSLGVQVHGGMGFIEETGAAQYYRDARILTIYEGTTAIQANDLVGRKTVRDQGAVAQGLVTQIKSTLKALERFESGDLAAIRNQLAAGTVAYERTIAYVVSQFKADIKGVFAGSVPYLMLAGTVLAGWQMARAALIAHEQLQAGQGDTEFLNAKITTARFYADHLLPRAGALAASITDGAPGVLALPEAAF
jgi:butyryl-CoA dehydrogenase